MKNILIFLLLLSGCASFSEPENELRVTEYGASGSYIPFGGGELGGCRVTQTGQVNACIEYNGQSCFVSTCPK